MLQQFFRCLLLVTIGIVVVYVSNLENKFPIMIGWAVGAVLAFIVGNIILNYLNKKNKKDKEKDEQ